MSKIHQNNPKENQVLDRLSNVVSIEPKFLWFVLIKYKRYIVLFPILITLIAYVVSKSMTPLYESTAKIIIKNESSNIIEIDEVYENRSVDQNSFINTNLEILKSREIKNRILNNQKNEQVINSLLTSINNKNSLLDFFIKAGLIENKELTYEQIINQVFETLTLHSPRNSNVINLSLNSINPDISYHILSFIIESYLQFDIDQKISITTYANDKIQDRLNELEDNLNISEKKLQDFKTENKLIDLGDIKNLKADEIKAISSRIVKAEQQIQNLQNDFQQIKIAEDNLEELISIKKLRENSEIQTIKADLDTSKSNLDALLLVYKPSHPKVKKALKTNDNLNADLMDLINENITVFAYELSNLESFVELSNDELEEARQELQELEIQELEMQKYVREVHLNERIYQTFMERLKETNEVKELQVSDAKILDTPSIPILPIFPRPLETSFFSFIFSIIALFSVASYYEIYRRAITNTDVLEANNFDVLGVIPKIKIDDSLGFKSIAFLENKDKQFVEAIKMSQVFLERRFKNSKVFLITSPVAQEGKTTYSLNIALSLAQKYKTLYLELDLRRPSLRKTFKMENISGLSDLIKGSDINFSDVLFNIEGSSLDIIPAGNPTNEIDFYGEQLKEFISTLKNIYDYIIIDSAPILPISDTLHLASSVDTTIFVARSEYTKLVGLVNAHKKITKTSNCTTTCIINYFDTQKLDYYNYSKYGSYYNTYYNYETK